MDIDSILNPSAVSQQKVDMKAALLVAFAVAETIREAGEVPSGVVYAALVGRVTLAGYESLLRTLKNAGLIEETPAHLLRWIGQAIAGGAR